MLKSFALAAALSVASFAAHAACDVPDGEPVRAMTSTFPAYVALADAMKECPSVSVELDQEVRTKAPTALEASPPLYDIVSVHNDTIVPFLAAGTIRSLNDLVEKHGQDLQPNQLIRIDGEIKAIALMVNLKHLMYREDIFADLGLEPPKTFAEMLATAEKIKEAGVVQYPLGMTYKGDWNIAAAFNDMYAALGGEFVNDDNTPAVNNDTGRKTLEMLKQAAGYMDPEYLVSDSTFVQQQMQQGKVAMSLLWASRAGAMDDPDESQFVGKIAGAPAVLAEEGKTPAAMLYWDGLAIASNISDEKAERAFKVIMESADEELVTQNADAAIWLIKGYKPARMAQAAIDTVNAGVVSSPSNAWKGLMIAALGDAVPGYMTGERTAEQTLEKIERDYLTAAREAGLVSD